jgi:hypothetical protein
MFFQIFIHHAKMNSYYKSQRDYRELYLAQLKGEEIGFRPFFEQAETVRYPDNVTLRDFIRYMCYPTLTYQDNFPVRYHHSSSTWKWVKNLSGRFLTIVLGLVSLSPT